MADARLRHDFRDASVLIEQATGFDSIPTIEEHYRNDDGLYHCVFPGCRHTSHGSQTMWLHVHFSEEHGRSFDWTIRDLIKALPSWPGAHPSTSSPGGEG